MEVAKAMHPHVDSVSGDTPVGEVARMMKTEDIGAVIVTEAGRLIGIITDRDLVVRVVAARRDPERTPAAEVMTAGVVSCRLGDSIEDAVHMMDQRKIRRLPVLDEKGRLAGMLSLGDIVHAAGHDLAGELLHAVADHHT